RRLQESERKLGRVRTPLPRTDCGTQDRRQPRPAAVRCAYGAVVQREDGGTLPSAIGAGILARKVGRSGDCGSVGKPITEGRKDENTKERFFFGFSSFRPFVIVLFLADAPILTPKIRRLKHKALRRRLTFWMPRAKSLTIHLRPLMPRRGTVVWIS